MSKWSEVGSALSGVVDSFLNLETWQSPTQFNLIGLWYCWLNVFFFQLKRGTTRSFSWHLQGDKIQHVTVFVTATDWILNIPEPQTEFTCSRVASALHQRATRQKASTLRSDNSSLCILGIEVDFCGEDAVLKASEGLQLSINPLCLNCNKLL